MGQRVFNVTMAVGFALLLVWNLALQDQVWNQRTDIHWIQVQAENQNSRVVVLKEQVATQDRKINQVSDRVWDVDRMTLDNNAAIRWLGGESRQANNVLVLHQKALEQLQVAPGSCRQNGLNQLICEQPVQ
jgi:hypothetical protein